jgi:hypothetical protein
MSLNRGSDAKAKNFQVVGNLVNLRSYAIILQTPHLMERAVIAAKQMRYFQLFTQRASFEELGDSARRAGFAANYEDVEHNEASFRWAVGPPEFLFFVSFERPERISVVAEGYRDFFGLVMSSHSRRPNISVEFKTALGKNEIGPNALLLRDMLLEFPDFEAGSALPGKANIHGLSLV